MKGREKQKEKEMSKQQKMAKMIASAGIPTKSVNVYGSQIVVTVYNAKHADKMANLISEFATVRGVVKSIDTAKENNGTTLKPSTVDVFRVFGVL